MKDKLTIKNAQKRRKELIKVMSSMKVKPGWIKYTRTVLEMTLKELAKLTGQSLPNVAQAEKRESEGKITIDTLSKLADAMECDFVYAFIPREDIPDLLQRKALEKAKRMILQAETHMSLEDQSVNEDIKLRIEMLAEKLLEKRKVW